MQCEIELAPPPQSADDTRAELGAVSHAVAVADRERAAIQQAINASGSIEQLGHLHDDWSRVNEDLAAARQRQTELLALLATMN